MRRSEKNITELVQCKARVKELEAQIARVVWTATAPCYLRPGLRVPRFVMRGTEVLAALKGEDSK
jgi:hypothetical protein